MAAEASVAAVPADVQVREVIKEVALLLIDTYVFKKFTAYSLRNLVAGATLDPPTVLPGSVQYEDDATEEDFRQLTAEVFKRSPGAKPGERGEWVKIQANEQLDLDVYAQALAYQKGLQRWDQARWEREFHERAKAPGEPSEPPLLALASEPAAPRAEPVGNDVGARRAPSAPGERRFFKKRT